MVNSLVNCEIDSILNYSEAKRALLKTCGFRTVVNTFSLLFPPTTLATKACVYLYIKKNYWREKERERETRHDDKLLLLLLYQSKKVNTNDDGLLCTYISRDISRHNTQCMMQIKLYFMSELSWKREREPSVSLFPLVSSCVCVDVWYCETSAESQASSE